MKYWLIRTGKRSEMLPDFLINGIACISYSIKVDLAGKDKKGIAYEFQRRLQEIETRYGAEAAKLFCTPRSTKPSLMDRFVNGISVGDGVVTIEKAGGTQKYHLGRIKSDYKFSAQGWTDEFDNPFHLDCPSMHHYRHVNWKNGSISRAEIPQWLLSQLDQRPTVAPLKDGDQLFED